MAWVINLAGALAGVWLAALPGHAAAAAGDVRAAQDAVRGKWQGAAVCGRKLPITLDIDKAEVKDGRLSISGKASGGDGKSVKIESVVFGRYDPADGLFQLSASPPLPAPGDNCEGTMVLGKCLKASGLLADMFKGNPEKQRMERLEQMANSSFQLVLGRSDQAPALVGTVHGTAFDCPEFQLTRVDRNPPDALASMSRDTEQAALDHLDSLRYGDKPPSAFPEARVYWMERLSRRGDALSTADLGRLYETGQPPLTRNLQTAVQYYRRAAEGGEVRAQRRLSRLLALGQGGVPQNLAESERWANAAKVTAASVGRYCVTPPMIAAYRELLEALKNDPGLRMLNLFGGGITGMQFEEGTFRIEGAGAEAVTTPDGPFLCRVVGRNEGGSVRNVKPEYAYAGEDEQGRLQRRDSGDFALARLRCADPSSARQECMDW